MRCTMCRHIAPGFFGRIRGRRTNIIGGSFNICSFVEPLADGRSPFHYMRRRVDLVERPHMHTALAVVPDGAECPQAGDVVDVQRPLISVTVDEVIWQ